MSNIELQRQAREHVRNRRLDSLLVKAYLGLLGVVGSRSAASVVITEALDVRLKSIASTPNLSRTYEKRLIGSVTGSHFAISGNQYQPSFPDATTKDRWEDIVYVFEDKVTMAITYSYEPDVSYAVVPRFYRMITVDEFHANKKAIDGLHTIVRSLSDRARQEEEKFLQDREHALDGKFTFD